MAALEGFELSIATGDVVVAEGLADGVAIAGVTLDVSALGLGDGDHDVVLDDDGATVIGQAAGLTSGQIKLGEFTEASAAATAVSLAGRGDVADVSADE